MKKVLALTLAVILAFGMMTMGFADSSDRVKEVKDDIETLGVSGITTVDEVKNYPVASSLDALEIYHNTTIRIWLTPDGFVWDDTKGSAKAEKDTPGSFNVTLKNMTSSNLSGVSVKSSWKKGGEYFNAPELKYKSGSGMYIEIKTKKGITLTTDKDIEGKIVVSYKSTKGEIALTGIASNKEETVSDDSDSVWVTKNKFFKPTEFIKALEVNFDNDDVQGYVNVFSGKKYYLWIEEDLQTKDEELVAKYDSIENAYHAYYSTNVNVSSTYVMFDLDEKYYVYNQDGKYLGMTTEKLPLASTYYLSSKKLDGFGTTDAEETPSDAPAASTDAPANENPAGGGDDVPSNANDNPGTGAPQK